MLILGVNDGHDAGAALVEDGRVIAAIQEERLLNIKNYSGAPKLSIQRVFKISGKNPSELDAIAIVSLNRAYAPLKEQPLSITLFEKLSPILHSHTFSKLYVKVLHKFRRLKHLQKIFKELKIDDKEVTFVEHHLAHASCAFYQRPWNDETLIFTLDGAGDGLSATISIGRDFNIERIASSTYYDSPGNILYSEITAYLGMKRWEHEYKVMGLAPYGRPEYCIDKIKRIIKINPKKPLEFQNISGACNTQIQKKLKKWLAGERFDNIAAATQYYFEELVSTWVKNAIKNTGISKIVCAGGSFLNVKANKIIREMETVDEAFFYPAADDGGTPVGAALFTYYSLCKRDGIKPKRLEIRDLYYGEEFNNEYIERTLKEKGIHAEYVDDIEGEIGELLAKGKIIARFAGRGEWGPRALGNRSILADPRDIRIVKRLNSAIKMRDFWMPFAPSILEERMNDYLVDAKPARYMIEAFDTKEKAQKEMPACLHPHDDTARPQTVNDWNPRFKRIIEEFETITGVGGILNTSFNIHGKPIAGTPELAFHTFENSKLDGVVLGNYLIMRDKV